MATKKSSPNIRKKLVAKKAPIKAPAVTASPVTETTTAPSAVSEGATKPLGTSRASRSDAKATDFARLPSVWELSRRATTLLWRNKKLFGGIILIYIVCNLLLVQTAGANDLTSLKNNLEKNNLTANSLNTGLKLYSTLVAGAGTGSTQAGAAYQSILVLIVSLAIIWALREILAGHKIRIRDTFYSGMYPLVPALLIILWIFMQLIPLAIGAVVYTIVQNNGIATSPTQSFLWGLVPVAGLCVSTYFLLSSLLALYVVTLPGMTPFRALRSAKKLVMYRRWTVLRKIIFIPFALFVAGAAVMLPFVLWLTPVAPWIYFLLSTGGLLVFHTYMYMLYREMLT